MCVSRSKLALYVFISTLWVCLSSTFAGNIINNAPIADAGKDAIYFRGAQVFLENLSTDPDGDSLEYRWWISSAPDGSTAVLTNHNSKTPY